MSQPSLPAHRPSRSPDGAKRTERQGSRWQQESGPAQRQRLWRRCWCSPPRWRSRPAPFSGPGPPKTTRLDTVEQNRAAMGVAPADSSYDQAERNRLTVGTHVDTSYDDIERLRAGRVDP